MRKINFVFNPSAASSLRQAFVSAGVEERIIAFFDDLSYGPIAPPERLARAVWIDAHLGYDADDPDWLGASDDFWRVAFEPDVLPVVWVDRHSASEFSGFLEFVFKMKGRDFLVIDVTDTSELHGKTSLGLYNPKQIIEHAFLAQATQPSNMERQQLIANWEHLRQENASLRFVNPEFRLISSPLSHFDELILSFVGQDWMKSAWIVAKTLDWLHAEAHRSVGDLLIWARLRDIFDSPLVDYKGDTSLIHGSWVRLASSHVGL